LQLNRLTVRWEPPTTRTPGARDTPGSIAARERFEAALRDAGRGLTTNLVHVCVTDESPTSWASLMGKAETDGLPVLGPRRARRVLSAWPGADGGVIAPGGSAGFDQGDALACSRQKLGRGQADDAAVDDRDIDGETAVQRSIVRLGVSGQLQYAFSRQTRSLVLHESYVVRS
jgi:hypothetical protein